MKAILTAAVLLGAAASAPAWAGEGAGYPVATPGTTTTMTMRAGGNTDPFQWSAATQRSQYTVTRGGNTDPFSWSATPVPPAPTGQAAAMTRTPG